MPTDVSQVPSKATVTSPLPPTQSHTPPSTTSPSTQESAPSRSRRGGDDDIYEFREPEPFEFEVRGKRESPFNEDRVHHHRILSPQQKKPGKEDEEDNPKATTVTFSCSAFKSNVIVFVLMLIILFIAEKWLGGANQSWDDFSSSKLSVKFERYFIALGFSP